MKNVKGYRKIVSNGCVDCDLRGSDKCAELEDYCSTLCMSYEKIREKWKPKTDDYVWYPIVDFKAKKMIFDGANPRHISGVKWNILFRTKALAQSALRDVKKVLKKARKV